MKAGKVYLVGAGPGDPGLITQKGLECLGLADLVLYDGLVNPLLLAHTRARAERTNRGRHCDNPGLNQQQINERLIEAAREGKTVVRLKGGDPFIFGRGSEEAAALANAGISYEVVPGVTAAVAASAYAGISLTHRDHASAVAFVTGHEDPDKVGSALDYDSLANFSGTLVFYMGLHRLTEIVTALIAAGKPGGTPAAVISRGTTPAQKTVSAALRDLPVQVAAAEIRAPSLIIVGHCVTQRTEIGWFERKPLFGQTVLIARPESQAASVVSKLWLLGAQPIVAPTIEILPPDDWAPIDRTLARLHEFDWLIFTSVNGVKFLFDRLWEIGGDLRRLGAARIAAIGDGTMQALAERQLRADLVPHSFRAEALAEELVPCVAGKRVLWPRASRGRDVLPTQLRAAGAAFEELVVYRNQDVAQFDEELTTSLISGEVNWICLSSPSIAKSFARLLTPAARARVDASARIASISPVTTAAAREFGLRVDAEAHVHNWDGILDAIVTAGP